MYVYYILYNGRRYEFMADAARKVGRPRKDKAKSERLEVRIFPEDKDILVKTSEKLNTSIGDLIHLFAQVCETQLIGNTDKQEGNNGNTTG